MCLLGPLLIYSGVVIVADGRKCVEDFVTQNPKSTAASIAAHLEKNGPAGEDVTSTSIRRYMKKWGYKYDTALKIYYHPKEAKRNPQVSGVSGFLC